eukprot:TRINITY_DN2352_c0_g1_i1.p1 TRINITY_DN2352_c0_g1~~TRINITY_DN2352_c0_g1_i1.p1  ORF type:complete len:170 (-),score=21.40 TRINITY_DN2352_c0_g1_i1:30-539(-)
MSISKVTVLFVSFILVVSAHICVWEPRQRGTLSITTPGDDSCYRPFAECGKEPAETPSKTLKGGQEYTIEFQQNLNHWYPKNAGWMDASISYKVDNVTDSDFLPIGDKIPDFNANNMVTQTNFTIKATIPRKPCDHCVLRVRYVSNNPDEAVTGNPNAIFYQCADITIN